MPIGAAIGIGSAVSGVYAAKKQSDSARRAGTLQGRAADDALAFEREQETRRKQEYDAEYARNMRLEDEDRALRDQDRAFRNEDRQFEREEYGKREARLAPYREFGGQNLGTLANLLRPSGEPQSLRIPSRPSTGMRSVADLATMGRR